MEHIMNFIKGLGVMTALCLIAYVYYRMFSAAVIKLLKIKRNEWVDLDLYLGATSILFLLVIGLVTAIGSSL